jgi:hypothetical protein
VDKLLSASEIAALSLPGIPTTKVAIAAKAKRENWYFEKTTGLGGTKLIYRVPEKYFSKSAYEAKQEHATYAKAPMTTAPAKVDTNKLELAMRTLDEWEQGRGIKIAPDRRPAVISVLYDYLERGEEAELARVLKALG